jgi:hypothetical protein
MEKSPLKIFNNPIGENWKEAWKGEASIQLLETLRANFKKLGFETHVQVIIFENVTESQTSVQRIFFYKIFVRKGGM